MTEKAKGKVQEAAGAIAGDEEKKAEGEARQKKASAREEREQHERTRSEQDKAERAEESRNEQEGKDGGGLLGTVGDTLSGR